ncbi:TIGR00266 family protein [Clostridia bacterium]|nr:TIGR00266 family protein [Clostridia bacterium]
MKYEIKGAPLPVVILTLDANESVKTERGAMSWMSPNMQMSTNATGGLSRMLSRESIFQNIYTAQGGPGTLACASSFPGDILAVEINPSVGIAAQKSSFLACETGVEMSIFFQGKIGAGFFGGEGFIMQKFAGSGHVFLEIDGSVITYNLGAGESIIVDTGCIAAVETTATISVETVKGIGNALFGGEGLFNTRVSGPGKVWLQTMPVSGTARALAPYLPSSK